MRKTSENDVRTMDGFAFPVEVIRTDRRRTASVYLEGDVVRVRVPRRMSDIRVRLLVTESVPWIMARFKEQSERPVPKPKRYISGEVFPYLGEDYRLKVIAGDRPSIRLEDACLVAAVPETDAHPRKTIKSALEFWYRSQAESHLNRRTRQLSEDVGVKPRSVKTRKYKARWGSCSIRGDITYDWRIILAPPRVVDYVIVHELCHLLEHNHSP